MRLPPLNALRAFEAAARHDGFIAAAAELGVTRGAISRQVKQLEEHLGVPLFHRHSRGVALNAAGRALLPVLSDAFARIAAGAAKAAEAEADLRIICPPTMAIRWLLPNIGAFRAAHPEIRVQVTADFYGQAGFDRANFNLGFSVEHWPNREADIMVQPLVAMILSPACAPALAGTLQHPADLARTRLLHESASRREWGYWLAAFPAPGVDIEAGDMLQNLDMAAKAAELGQGVVMADLLLCRDELARGSLVLPFPNMTCNTPLGHFALIGPRAMWEDPAVAVFRAWIAELAKTDSSELFRAP